jgi:hypothetical protein
MTAKSAGALGHPNRHATDQGIPLARIHGDRIISIESAEAIRDITRSAFERLRLADVEDSTELIERLTRDRTNDLR